MERRSEEVPVTSVSRDGNAWLAILCHFEGKLLLFDILCYSFFLHQPSSWDHFYFSTTDTHTHTNTHIASGLYWFKDNFLLMYNFLCYYYRCHQTNTHTNTKRLPHKSDDYCFHGGGGGNVRNISHHTQVYTHLEWLRWSKYMFSFTVWLATLAS